MVLIINTLHIIIISDLLTSQQTLAWRGPAWGGWWWAVVGVTHNTGSHDSQLVAPLHSCTPGQHQIQTLSNLVNLCLETPVRSLLQYSLRSFAGQLIHYKYFEPLFRSTVIHCIMVYNSQYNSELNILTVKLSNYTPISLKA